MYYSAVEFGSVSIDPILRGAVATILYFAVGIAVLIAGFLIYRNANVASDWRVTLVIAGMIAAPLVFWASTVFGVKASMIPSVPFANIIRR